MGKSANRARATATRWRCPPESRVPHRAHRGAEGVGQPCQPGAEAHPGQSGDEVLVGGGTPPDAEVLGQRGVEEVGSLLDQADDAANVVGGEALQWHPVERDLPGVGRQEAHEQVGQGGLAGAARADQGDATSGRQLQVHATQRGRARRPDRRPRRRAG